MKFRGVTMLVLKGGQMRVIKTRDSSNVVPREGVGDGVVFAWDVPYYTVVLGDSREVPLLTRGHRVGLLGKGVNEGHVISLDGEGRALQEMAEVTYSRVNRQ